MKKIYTVEIDYVDTRLDRWFKKNISNVPQSLIEKYLRRGKIKVNHKKIWKSFWYFVSSSTRNGEVPKSNRRKIVELY